MSSATKLISALVEYGCDIRLPLNDYLYGANMYPDEDYMITRPARYATLVDKNGYMIELLEVASKEGVTTTALLRKVILYVEDLNESIEFYTKVLGMTLYRKRSNVNSMPKDASMVAHMVR
jgi:hypothetical protein